MIVCSFPHVNYDMDPSWRTILQVHILTHVETFGLILYDSASSEFKKTKIIIWNFIFLWNLAYICFYFLNSSQDLFSLNNFDDLIKSCVYVYNHLCLCRIQFFFSRHCGLFNPLIIVFRNHVIKYCLRYSSVRQHLLSY